MFSINPFKTSKDEKHVPNTVRASDKKKPITVSQPLVITKKDVNSDFNGLSSTGVDNTTTKRPQPRSNTKHDRVPSTSKSSRSKNKEAEVKEHHRNFLLSKNNKHISSTCNNIKINSQDVISKVVCAMCKKCLIYVNRDKCLRNYGMAKTLVVRNKGQGFFQRKPNEISAKGCKAKEGCSKHMTGNLKLFVNFVWKFMGTVRFGNDHVAGLLKFKYHKEHLYPSCEQGKSKKASHPPKPVPNSRQRLHLLHMDLCGPMRFASINGKRYVLVIVEDYSCYMWIHFLRSKDEAPAVIITFLKWITVLLQKPDISFLYVFGALCYLKNDREDIGKLGAKGDIGFLIWYSADSCAYRIYNRRTKKIMETMNVSFDELSAMAFEQRSSKPGLQSELDLLFEAMYDDYIGGQPSATRRTILTAQEPQVRQTSTASTTIADIAPTPTNSSSLATNIPITSQDVNELNSNAMVDSNTFFNP
nr:retrovirus-related Pol polyprotein from transposon TNT 1-94 [Tanacetum cinerariifolium]